MVRPLTWLVVLVAAFAALAAFGGAGLVDRLRDRGADVLSGEGSKGQGASQISASEFLGVGQGTTLEQVRELVGKPESTSRTTVEGVVLECWYYGIAGGTGAFQLCFADSRLVSRFRFGAQRTPGST